MIYLFSAWYIDMEGRQRHIDLKAESQAEFEKKINYGSLPNISKQIYCLPIPGGM